MEPRTLMSLLADKPPCCAGLRAEATKRIVELEARVETLDKAIAENHKIIWRQDYEIGLLRNLVRAIRDVNITLDGKR